MKAFAEANGIEAVPGAGHRGLGKGMLHHGSNSGYQAINFAYLQGATRIFLLGYDMGTTGGKNHWFGDHPKELTNGNYKVFIDKFTPLARDLKDEGVEVINLTRSTNLYQFKRDNIENYF